MVHGKEAIHESGAEAAAGSFLCVECSLPLSLDHPGEIPACANCGGTRFKRASLFEQPTLAGVAVESPGEAPASWLRTVRSSITEGAQIAIHQDGRARVIELAPGWSRIGRSGSAEIRLDDPTVSRRHAVIVRTPEDELRVLDDRSMNGIAVNGEPVDWSPLVDGDELQIGRYTLYVIAP
ncbi:MAG: FHA domain-containing protein [Actinomycetota bacterium]|nr:FHA domain-containing protein [Actinomycetota bacterium]